MVKSIQYFMEEGVKNLERFFVDYAKDMTKLAELVYGITQELQDLGCRLIAEELEMYDEWLRESALRKMHYEIVRRDETGLLTSLGMVRYKKTLFKDKAGHKTVYLLDKAMQIKPHTRISEDGKARILEEAVGSSYRRGGENVSVGSEFVSKQTVMKLIHSLRFPEYQKAKEKKAVPYLYIDADEDHVSLQYLERKGDIGKRRRINTLMPKLLYVYEGIELKDGKRRLINARYFGGNYDGSEGIKELWGEVDRYIRDSYDEESLKRVYINGDGAFWIKSGETYIGRSKFVLDKFHLHKYIIAATAHLKDSTQEARGEIYRALHKRDKALVAETFDKILNATEGGSKYETVMAAREYILGNWKAVLTSLKAKDDNLECSAEGHISHIYADRMSSRPLGWSRIGADKMARLRVYRQNGGDMLELVRFQNEPLQKAAGAEEVIYSASEMIAMENRNKRRLGELADIPTYTIPYTQVKKIAYFKDHIWGL